MGAGAPCVPLMAETPIHRLGQSMREQLGWQHVGHDGFSEISAHVLTSAASAMVEAKLAGDKRRRVMMERVIVEAWPHWP